MQYVKKRKQHFHTLNCFWGKYGYRVLSFCLIMMYSNFGVSYALPKNPKFLEELTEWSRSAFVAEKAMKNSDKDVIFIYITIFCIVCLVIKIVIFIHEKNKANSAENDYTPNFEMFKDSNAGTISQDMPDPMEIFNNFFEGSQKESNKENNNPTNGNHNGYEWVDLGLPSGTKWATKNVGASSPSDNGYYFAWGETSTKRCYTWENLKYRASGDSFGNVTLSKYVTNSKYGSVDNKTELDLNDDAAYVFWGAGWCMPTIEQIKELEKRCKWIWTYNGCKVIGPNGNSIFLPAAGTWNGNSLYNDGSVGRYWSRTLNLDDSAYYLFFNSSKFSWHFNFRFEGRSVRAVYNE